MAEKLQTLTSILEQLGSALVCFSGGVDSTVLLKVAVDTLGDRAIALTADSPSLPRRELDQAREMARTFGARHLVLPTEELQDPRYTRNPANRCYFCKSELLRLARREAERLGLAAVLLGTNTDDLGGHRPGLKAASESGARHPLVEADFGKQDVRELARELGIDVAEKPEMACLASRFPYGSTITSERLQRVERFENGLENLGFSGVRVRFHDSIARLELPAEDLERAVTSPQRQAIVTLGRELGFAYVTLDLAGYRRGAMNEVLPGAQRDPDPQQVAIAHRVHSRA